MRDLFDKEFQKEMDDFFDYIDHEVLGKPLPEPEVEEDMNRAADDEADDMDRDARFAADAEETELYNSVPPCTSMTPVGDK